LGIRLILGSAGLEPSEGVIVARRGRIRRGEEFLELMTSGGITGIGALFELGVDGCGEGDLLLAGSG